MGLNRQTVAMTPEAAALSFLGGLTRYEALGGSQVYDPGTESWSQVKANDSYTLSGLTARVTVNNLTGSSTIRFRKNGANGKQSVSVPALTSGTFEDTANTDDLVSGDLANTQIVTGADGAATLSIRFITYLLAAPAQTTILIGAPANLHRAADYYACIGGSASSTNSPIEGRVQSLFRTATTLSNLRTVVLANTLNAATTLRTRKNGANGGQSVSIGAGATGAFEDTTGSDSISAGDLVNYGSTTTATVGDLQGNVVQLRVASARRNLLTGKPGSSTIDFGVTQYTPIEGGQDIQAAEGDRQVRSPAAFTARNAFAIIAWNTINGASTIRFRKNGANGNMTMSVPASTTGTFEDTANTDSIAYADLINWQWVTGGSAGIIAYGATGVEQVPSVGIRSPSAARSAAVAGQAPGARASAAARSPAVADP